MTIKKLLLAASIAGAFSAQAATIGPQLQDLMDGALPTESIEVIVTFDGIQAPGAAELDLLSNLGLSGVTMQSLPMAGVVATPAQIASLSADDSVRSIYYNAPVEFELRESTQISSVDRLRADQDIRIDGFPVSGSGVGVLMNDSGVDGTHADISYPDHLVQNVRGQTNLQSIDGMLPVTYLEDQINTDVASSHGTHVIGIVGGNGARSNGEQEGVAPGADLIGYGSGAVLLILDTLGGFDYALTHQFDYNIRVVTNSFGSTGDTNTAFDPENPTNIATKKLSDRGVVVVFSAGNSGAGEGTITGNFKKAPWVVTVAAGDKNGLLADFSSRGVRNGGGMVEVDGELFEWQDRPTITAPGVDVYSARSSTGESTVSQEEIDHLGPGQVPFYTVKSGTSMAAPHTAGIIALILEANPNLTWREIKPLLERTATNIPGRETWEVGGGYINAYAAVQDALNMGEFGDTTNINRNFNSTANFSVASREDHTVLFSPVGPNEVSTFEVSDRIGIVNASANVGENTVAVVLTDPLGNRYGSGISLPVLGQNIAATGPGVPGTWTVEFSGIGSVSGVALDPLGVTNGTALPGELTATVTQLQVDGFTGLDDVQGHPGQSFIELAVRESLLDSNPDGNFNPDGLLTRGTLAEWLTIGAGVRQAPAALQGSFTDTMAASADAATAIGAPLKSLDQDDNGVMLAAAGQFDPADTVNREQLAFSLVQALGLEDIAMLFDGDSGDIQVEFNGQAYTIEDQYEITPLLRGYVQLALELGLIRAEFASSQGPFDPFPTLTASFGPDVNVTRAEYAASAVQYLNIYQQAAE